jgi:hypothetical protein
MTTKLDYGYALRSLYDHTDAVWVLRGTESLDGLEWSDANTQPRPTKEELDTELARLQAEYDAKEYQRLREPNYPSIKDQLDMLWHAIDSGTVDKSSAFYTTIKAVKDANPKP